ncbi:hypothetical protein CIT292_10210 [Citrobacter youngae ATCC 29220]|uniref:Uncharacterized protein n=1 Tax=Citrobacter youngae ATCC 29220 TaxID=500640 RepID=D4BI46_9ENTR|nr:hypothetical protein CIT292_10210 [Citrobacter youngae ATCC 29220]
MSQIHTSIAIISLKSCNRRGDWIQRYFHPAERFLFLMGLP